MLGDLNVNFFNSNNRLTQCFNSFNLNQVVTEPTRITNYSETLLDPIFINSTCVNTGTLNADMFTDHRLVFCDISFKLQKQRPATIVCRDFKNIDMEKFNADLVSIPWDNIFRMHNIEDKVKFLTDHILLLYDAHAPLKTVRVSKARAPWLTDVIKILIKLKNNALTKYKRLKTPESWEYYRGLRNYVKSAVRREKAAYLKYLEEQKNLSSFYKALKSFNIQCSGSAEIPHRLSDVARINDYFVSIFKNSDNVCADQIRFYNNHRISNEISFSFKFVETYDIIKIINGIKTNSRGSDGVTVGMIKPCLHIIVKHITHIVNVCLESGYFPNSWKTALVVPLSKIPKAESFSDLRPISLLPILSKILEKVVSKQLNDYLLVNNILPVHQSGFRKGHSTVTALANLGDNIIHAYDSNLASILVLLDFSKAFDTINHNLLVAKCHFLGFNESVKKFFKCYLTERKQGVILNNKCSNYRSVCSGVPQGSVLGPLLFLMYTLDMPKVVLNCNVQFFADDTQLYHSFKYREYDLAVRNINSDLQRISEYALSHNLALNPKKSKILLFCPNNHRDYLKSQMHILINNEEVQFTSEAKNLGIQFDEKLRFIGHVVNLTKQCFLRLRLLYVNRHLLSYKMKKMLCESLIMSRITYGDIVYYPCLDLVTSYRLQKIQNSCCRLVCNLRKFDHVTPSYRTLGWLRVHSLFRYHFILFLVCILKTSTPAYLSEKLIFRSSIHSVNIREQNKLTMPHHKTAIFRRSFTYQAVKIFNSLSSELISNMFKPSFRKVIKQDILSKQ